jgi:hypothetical protein
MKMPDDLQMATLRDAVEYGGRVEGVRHSFYRYPARFSPVFSANFIRELTRDDDWILDPFMGGGTSIVEALAMGRRALGADLSSLAHFITTSRTTPLSSGDISVIRRWVNELRQQDDRIEQDDCTLRNIPAGVGRFCTRALVKVAGLLRPRQRTFARMVLLRLGQWAIERENPVEAHDALAGQCIEIAHQLIAGLDDLVAESRKFGVSKSQITGRRRLLHRSAVGIHEDRNVADLYRRVRLVITSPPYPGVHVLYHRWQLRGRKETAAPFWLANVPDGQPESFYTFGGRKQPQGFDRYFQTLHDAFSSIRGLLHSNAVVAQLVAFSDPDVQLDRYIDTMRRAGYRETRVADTSSRLSRDVPNRRWYASLKPKTASGREFLLLHEPI